MVGSGTTTLITYNEEMYHVMKILKYPEGFGLSLKGGNKLIQNQKKSTKIINRCYFIKEYVNR